MGEESWKGQFSEHGENKNAEKLLAADYKIELNQKIHSLKQKDEEVRTVEEYNYAFCNPSNWIG